MNQVLGGIRTRRIDLARVWQFTQGRLVIMESQTNIFHIVGAAHTVGCLAHLLYGWHQQTHQHSNDGNHHQQFDQREGLPPHPHRIQPHFHGDLSTIFLEEYQASLGSEIFLTPWLNFSIETTPCEDFVWIA